LLVAVDDLQWLDQPTADVLAFAARRLHGPAVRFLLAARPGTPSIVERALGPAGPQTLKVEPLSLGAVRRMLSDRLGVTMPRHVLRQVFEITLGYPLFALEVGRMLAAEGRSNKEIARALHVTVSTVEAHLSRAYAKLGVRSRSQLPGRLPPTAGEPAGRPDRAGSEPGGRLDRADGT
jgi:hypothetical protein